jgi:helix-turn-helix protein
MPRSKLLTVEQARTALGGISRTTFYALRAEGSLPVVKIRDRTFIRPEDIDALIARSTRQVAA